MALATAKNLIAESEAYEARPTKASSKRLRAHLTNLKRVVTPAKKELLQADKA